MDNMFNILLKYSLLKFIDMRRWKMWYKV